MGKDVADAAPDTSDYMTDEPMLGEGESPVMKPPGQLDEVSRNDKGPIGACDSSKFWDTPEALINFRYATIAFRWDRVVYLGSPRLRLSKQLYTAYANGQGEASLTAGFPATLPLLTTAETDGQGNGSIVVNSALFKMYGLSIAPRMSFFTELAPSADAGTLESFAAWLERYEKWMQQRLFENVTLLVRHGELTCNYKMGRLKDHPSVGGITQGIGVTNGRNFPNAFFPNRAVDKSGGKESDTQIRIDVQSWRTFDMIEDPTAQIPANVEAVYTSFDLQLIGCPMCDDGSTSTCDLPGQKETNARIGKLEKNMDRFGSVLEKIAAAQGIK